jgi:hypothetical protein
MESTVTDPQSRRRLMWRLECFSDTDYQRRVWIERRMPRADYDDNFDDAINDFFDDLERPPGRELTSDIGTIFRSAHEAESVDAVREAVDAALVENPEADALVILASAAWAIVVQRARQACVACEIHQPRDLLT